MSNQLISVQHGTFDTKELQKELAIALEADRKYKLTDEMKKRAIHTAGNYDEFKNLVACADLRPISQKEMASFNQTNRNINIAYKKTRYTNRKQSHSSTASCIPEPNTIKLPRSAAEFCREWRRTFKTNEAKHEYLNLITASRLQHLFAYDLDADIFMEIIRVFKHVLTDKKFILDCCVALCNSSRYQLTYGFLNNQQREELGEIYQLLKDAETEEINLYSDGLKALKTAFRLP